VTQHHLENERKQVLFACLSLPSPTYFN
jgi:hypothetical protein